METLDRETLNRATLERQLLFRRSALDPVAAVDRVVGLQAQEPHEPYVGLWSRLGRFEPEQLAGPLEERRVVRTLLMRRTQHLVTNTDCLELRPICTPMLLTRMRGALGRQLPGVDLDELAEAGAPLFAERPRTTAEVAGLLATRWPDAPRRPLSDALSTVVPLVQTPPRGLWGQRAPARCTTIESWLGPMPDVAATEVTKRLVLRYLRAFGPATSSDVRAWSGLSGLPAVIAELKPGLRSYRDEQGRELLDVPDASPFPSGASPPVRFLPAFDNVVLGYADRSRIIDDEHRGLSVAGARFVLVAGRVAAVWTTTPVPPGLLAPSVEVAVRPLRRLTAADRDDVYAEGTRLAAFLSADGSGAVTVG